MEERDSWLALATKLDWEYSYVSAREVFPEQVSGRPWLEHGAWRDWEESYRTTFREYAAIQCDKERAVFAVQDALSNVDDYVGLDRAWLSALKLHGATLALAEFAAVVGNLKAVRFGRDCAWRCTATFGALDELRHSQIPLAALHGLIAHEPQFDWTHRFFHTNNWVAIAARHMVDELLVTSDPIEFAIATNFVFETGFTNLQFIGLSAVAHQVGDRMFEVMVQSIQTDEARHSQTGGPVLETLMRHDPEYAQRLVDKWFWRTWLFFAVVTGFAMDYLTPLERRDQSFKEFVEEWVLDQFRRRVSEFGLRLPWYWGEFVASLDYYHHMVYASAYTYRATVWFDFALPGPEERAWLSRKYEKSWPEIDPVWERVTERCRKAGPGVEAYTLGATPVGFCDLCQLVLCGGTPRHNTARTVQREGRTYIFCSAPCQWIFEQEPERYAAHESVVGRILTGKAPGNLAELVRAYFGLDERQRGKDVAGGAYPWLRRPAEARGGVGQAPREAVARARGE